MTRLSNNPVTIRRQIEHCEAALAAFQAQLETVPDDDLHEQASLTREIQQDKGRRAKLNRHLLGLEIEFDEMLEGTRGTPEQYDEQ